MISLPNNKMADESSLTQSRQLKLEGNELFKQGKYADSAAKYSEAINKCSSDGVGKSDLVVYRKNRAACWLKLSLFEKAIEDCMAALEVSPSDSKALYRLAQAYDEKGDNQQALMTMKKLLSVDPKNSEVKQLASKLTTKMRKEMEKMTSTDGLVNEMCTALTDMDATLEKRIKAARNMAILSRESAGAERITKGGGLPVVLGLLDDPSPEIASHAVQTLVGICSDSKARATEIMQHLSMDKVALLVSSQRTNVAISVLELCTTMVLAVTEEAKPPKKAKDSKVPFSLGAKEMSVLMPLTKLLSEKLSDNSVSKETRDAILEYFVKTSPRHDVGSVYLKEGLVGNLLHVAANTSDVSRPFNPLPVSKNARLNVSVILSELYKSLDMWMTEEKKAFEAQCTSFIGALLQEDSLPEQIHGMTALCAVLQGVVDVGNSILSNEAILSKMVALAESDDPQSQVVAAESLALAASDKDRCGIIMAQGLEILQKLYQLKNDHIRVRALVGLCKLGSTGGWNVNAQTLPAGSRLELKRACRLFLLTSDKDISLQKWAVEGLAFLTMDAEVKEDMMQDKEILEQLFSLVKVKDQSFLYGLASIFVNLTNSYDKIERTAEMEEMEKLGKYAGEQIPQEHEFDKDDFLNKRVSQLIKMGTVAILLKMAETDSHKVREQVSRIFLSFVNEVGNRGLVVQNGGSKCLVQLALNSTDTGKFIAAQALAKIGITTDPKLAFPGQRMLEVVRPILMLLKSEKGLQQFEGLMALTNLASLNDDVRKRIIKEKGVAQVESLMFEDHEMIRRAATEAMCNLVVCEEVAERFLQDDVERVKVLTLFSGEDDRQLAKAAAGSLCQLSIDKRICKKIMDVKQAIDIFKEMIATGDQELIHRALFIMGNIIESDQGLAEKILDNDGLVIFNAFAQDEKSSDKIRDCASAALQKAVDYGLIQPNPAK